MATSSNVFTSPFSVKETIDRVVAILQKNNVTVFARVNHGEAAKKAGLSMQDEELLIFGNPKVGTDLMIENPAIGIELPLKILAWREGSTTKISYQNTDKLADIYNIKTHKEIFAKMSGQLKNLVENAINNKQP